MKKRMKKLCSLVLLVCMLTSIFAFNVPVAAAEEADPFANSAFKNYITREGHTLYDGDKVLQLAGFAFGQMWNQEDGGMHNSNEFEMRSNFEIAKQLGQPVIRTGWLSFRDVNGPDGKSVGGVKPGLDAMVEGTGVFNEAGFRAMDKVLQLANEYGIRLIIPLIDGNNYHGGIANVAAWRGLGVSDAWVNNQVIEDTKAIYSYVLNRTNYYTGVKYKDDPAVLCWQLGNEMERYGITDEWVSLMAAHIKSIDTNHLVMAPQNRFWRGILDDPNIDMVDGHMYEATPFYECLEADAKDVEGKKVLMYGELGFKPGTELGEFLETLVTYPQVLGGFVFMISSHNAEGGMYRHGTSGIIADKWSTYNYPGFENEKVYEKMQEKELFSKVREINYRLKGEEVPAVPVPEAPHLLPVTDVKDIWWRWPVGAESCTVERAESESGPWSVIGENIHGNAMKWKGDTMFADSTAADGKTYYYRIKAINASGESEWSNIRKSGDASLDEILQAEADEKAANIAAGNVTVEIPTVEGTMGSLLPEVVVKANLPEEVKSQLGNAVVLKIDDSTAFVNNTVRKIDPDNENITAFTKNDRTLVPVRFLAEAFDCTVNWDEGTQTVAVMAGLTSARLQIGSTTMMVGDTSITIDQPAELIDDARTVAPLRAVCENTLGKSVLYKDGIIVVYDGKSVTDPESEEFWTALKEGFENPVDDSIVPDEAANEDNLLLNGGFESGDKNEGWTASSPNVNIVGEDAHSGVYSLKFEGNATWKGIRQLFAVEKNTDYVFSFYAKAPKSMQTETGLSATFKILDEPRTDKWLTEDMRVGSSDGWKQYYFEFNSNEQNNVWIVWAFCNGTFYADDFICVPAGTETALELKAKYDEQKATAIDDANGALLVDDMDDFSKIYSYSKPGGWRVFTDNPQNFDNDLMRIARTVNETKEIVYKVENMHNFWADIPYCVNIDAKFYVSPDGENWTEIAVNETQYSTRSNWINSTFTAKGEFPVGTNYFKIEFGPGNKDFWSPTIKRVEIY